MDRTPLKNYVNLFAIQGLSIVADIYVSDYELKIKTWPERLFTLPWRPWRKFKSVYRPAAYVMSDGSVMVSYKTKEIIMKEIAKRLDDPNHNGTYNG